MSTQKQPTKEKILKSAKKLFAKDSFSAVSMDKIAKKLKLSKAALYYFFKNKDDLYSQVLEIAQKELIKVLKREVENEGKFKKKFFNVIQAYLNYGLKEMNLIQTTMKAINSMEKNLINKIHTLRQGVKDVFINLIKEGQAKKIFKTENPELTATLLVGAMDSYITTYSLTKKMDWPVDKVSQHIISLFP